MVSYLGNGGASVSVGPPNYDYLGAASGTFSLASVEGSLGVTGTPTNSSTTSSSITEGTATTSSTASSAPSSGGGIPDFAFQSASVAVFVAVVVVSYLVVRRPWVKKESSTTTE